jgi:hypothetical protein
LVSSRAWKLRLLLVAAWTGAVTAAKTAKNTANPNMGAISHI